MKGMRLLVVAALVAACGKSSKKQEEPPKEQTFAAAMTIICEAGSAPGVDEANPADRARVISQHVDANVTNAEARELFTRVGSMPPSEVNEALEEAARKAGLDRCALVAASPARGQVTITASAIVVEGNDVPPERVEAMVGALVKNTGKREVTIAIEPDVPYARVTTVLNGVIAAGGAPVLLDDAGAVPLAVPTAALAAPSPDAPTPLRMLAMVSPDRLVVASASGLEGTVAQPILSISLADPEEAARALSKTLGEIVDRRWSGGRERAPEDQQIVVMAEPTVATHVLMPLLAAARRAPDGRELFPDVALAVGIK